MSRHDSLSRLFRVGLSLATLGGMSACNTLSRMSEVGSGPEISRIENPTQKQGYQPISMPMPQPVAPPQNANSLWRPGARAFFKDQRAKDVGDILTIAVSIADNASLTSQLNNNRSSKENAQLANLAGFENSLASVLPSGANLASLANLGATSVALNNGATTRSETINVTMAAVITQVLPNGNLVISGRQEFRVNYEMRELSIQGIIRPEDISSSNSISSEKIAEARVYYGGRGMVSDITQPRWGQEIFDIVFPF
ncbi:flagellar basal body L-ring protein FlgH [Magnetospirillum molischianum]|uniref:Flagellar L-ring protein n=1 Tax=Magnetospirillum molischianum DSM 120 TaxID=1150626 RepID=H8FPS0_MAGML|nr:flagellar basal body L-ring protein FlgH [Magnetospirillum molischianum]CCG40358.1 Flagellar L-ring protein (Basal body L-ring protein) [Magnetospirillum molischianum DSM 120]